MIVRLPGGKIVPFALSLVVENFCIFWLENIHLKLMTSAPFLVTFGDVSIKFEQTQYHNETFHSLVQRHVFAPTLQLSFEEKISLSYEPALQVVKRIKVLLQQFGTCAESVVLLYV